MKNIMKLADEYAECMYLRREQYEAREALKSEIYDLYAKSADQQEEIKLLNIRLNTAHDQINGLHAMHQSAKMAFEQVCKERDALKMKIADPIDQLIETSQNLGLYDK